MLDCKLTPDHKYSIIKAYYASPDFSLDLKKALRDATFKDDNSDKATAAKKVCELSLPNADLKEQLWNEITDPNSKDTFTETKQKISGFW